METIWENLMKNKYRKIKTPRQLMIHLKNGDKSGKFLQGNYFNDFNVIREDSSAWVVESEKGGKYPAGGIYYVNKKNPNQAVWD